MMEKCNRVKAVISLDAVEHNFHEMRKNIAQDTKMIAVVKANAYGHGAVQIAHLIQIIYGDLPQLLQKRHLLFEKQV